MTYYLRWAGTVYAVEDPGVAGKLFSEFQRRVRADQLVDIEKLKTLKRSVTLYDDYRCVHPKILIRAVPSTDHRRISHIEYLHIVGGAGAYGTYSGRYRSTSNSAF